MIDSEAISHCMGLAVMDTDTQTLAPVLPDAVAATLVDPNAFADIERISDAYTWLRQNMPLGVAKLRDFDPFWVVTKHADILEISKNNKAFHNGDRATILTDQYTDAMVRYLRDGSPHLARTMAHMDDPDHRKYRALTSNWFMSSNLAHREEAVRGIAKEFVDRMLSHQGVCDFAKDVAMLYPLRVIMQILGVPIEDEPLMLKLTKQVFGNLDEDLNQSGKAKQTAEQGLFDLSRAVETFFKYFDVITRDRRASPRDDLATVIANGTIDGEAIGNFEAMSYYSLVSTAGHDTVSASIADGIRALCEFPDEFDKVRSDPTLIPGLVEESIRWSSPVRHFMRTATADYPLRGQNIQAGDWLMLCYLSGDRDEEVFHDPFKFKIDRTPNKQLAFGFGGHMCLGQHLARLEMRVFFEELLPRIKSISLAGTPEHSKAVFVGGLKSLPIHFEPA
jgi:cytochrome P450